MSDLTGTSDETVTCYCSLYPSYAPVGGHLLVHHSHTRLEASDVDGPVVPSEIGDTPDLESVGWSKIHAHLVGNLCLLTEVHAVPCGCELMADVSSWN